jgi:uncharacterized membrane protein YsdA (DUF1294 family)
MIKKTASKKILTPSDSVSNDAPQNNKDFDDIKTQDILSKINLTDIFTKYSVLIPIILSLWILYQFYNLIIIGKLTFFSWSQVINDTVILFFPVLFWILGVILSWQLNPHEEKKYEYIKNLVAYIVVTGVIYALLLTFKIPEFIRSLFLIGFMAWAFLSLFIYIRIITWSQNMKSKFLFWVLKIITLIGTLFIVFDQFRENQYKDLSIETKSWVVPVIYMNDAYIFTSGSILHNTDESIFNYTWVSLR